MNAVLRGVVIYLALLILFRITGRRSLAQVTTFDFVLLLIISEATQQAMLGEDYSVTNGLLVVTTLLATDVGLSLWKRASPRADRWSDGLPLVLVENGQPLAERLHKARVDESDILAAAREKQGLGRMEQIRYAVLERSGGISIIPREEP